MLDQSQLPKDVDEALTMHDVGNVMLKRLEYAEGHIRSVLEPAAFPPGLSPEKTFDAIEKLAQSIIFWGAVLRQKYAAERG